MSRTLLFGSWLLALGSMPAQAALLFELSWQQPQPVPLPAFYTLNVRDDQLSPNLNSLWIETITTFPANSWADPSIVTDMNRMLFRAKGGADLFGAQMMMYNGGQRPEPPPINSVPGDPPKGCATCWYDRLLGAERSEAEPGGSTWLARVAAAGWTATPYVDLPPHSLWNGSHGWEITAMERIVTADGQTVRFYGVSVPEPAAVGLLVFGLGLHVSGRSLRRTSSPRRSPG